MKTLLKRFHLNGNTIGFHPQTQKFDLPLTPPFTVGVKKLYEVYTIGNKISP